jgi:cytochrome c-type biogenesis protein CcmE
MKDDGNRVAKVVLDGGKPNNFELATSVVAKGKLVNGEFHATEVLTKCPSKYEGTSETVKKTL